MCMSFIRSLRFPLFSFERSLMKLMSLNRKSPAVITVLISSHLLIVVCFSVHMVSWPFYRKCNQTAVCQCSAAPVIVLHCETAVMDVWQFDLVSF